ncbi:MAG: prenyltransferase [Myxococcales bacterium]
MSRAVAWLRASRLPSQSYIAPPLLLGQALAHRATGRFDGGVCALLLIFGLCDQLLIVYANDYADRANDQLNRTATPFSGGSRVLVDGALSPSAVLRAGVAAAIGTLLISGVLALAYDRRHSIPLGLLALFLVWAYSYQPLRLSYRGGGELLQALGVGLCLPLFGYYNQSGELGSFPWALLWALLPTHLACAMATAMPDEPSDRLGDKRTSAVWLGGRRARRVIVLLEATTVAALIALARGPGLTASYVWVAPALLTALLALGPPGEPGSDRLSVQVAVAIAVTVSTVLGLTLAAL